MASAASPTAHDQASGSDEPPPKRPRLDDDLHDVEPMLASSSQSSSSSTAATAPAVRPQTPPAAPLPPGEETSPRTIRREIENLQQELEQLKAKAAKYEAVVDDPTQPSNEKEVALQLLLSTTKSIEAVQSQLATKEQRLQTAERSSLENSSKRRRRVDVETPPGVVEFWDALRTNTDVLKASEVLDLKANVLGDPDEGTKIFVRQSYLDLHKEVQATLRDNRHFVLLGTPGIGKTFFGYFLLLQFARDGRTVVYYDGRSKYSYRFQDGMVDRQRGEDAHGNELDKPEVIYMVDSARPLEKIRARTILITSPAKDVWYKFVDAQHCNLFYMPLWSLAEMEKLRTTTFKSIDEASMNLAYSRWGGVPRHALAKVQDHSHMKLLDDAIMAVSEDVLLSARNVLQSSAPHANVPHRVIHLDVMDGYGGVRLKFATTYVRNRVLDLISQRGRQHLIDFVRNASSLGHFSSLRGDGLEWLAHQEIADGGDFRVRRLVPSGQPPAAVETVTLPKRTLRSFASEEDVKKERSVSVYFVPEKDNYESVDAFCRPDTLFQLTVAATHPCKHAGLFHVLEDLLSTPAHPRLYFVVPEDKFDKWVHAQSYIGTNKRVIEATDLRKSVKSTEQYVLEYKLPISGQ